jgi:hypothetical protein
VKAPVNPADLDSLKIVIVSTPKTGNTWLKRLLAHVYDLPIVRIGIGFDPVELDGLGQRWIAHQHYVACSDVREYGRRHGLVFVTTIRHPCDALLSKFHHARNFGHRLAWADIDRSPILLRDGATPGKHTASYIIDGFSTLLDISIGWVRSGQSHIARYEDLRRDPVATLQELTAAICPVQEERIDAAVQACGIGKMRETWQASHKFFREGKVGGWREALPGPIVELFRHLAPYPSQFAELGYSLDQDQPLSEATAGMDGDQETGLVQPPFLDQAHATAEVECRWRTPWPPGSAGLRARVSATVQAAAHRLLQWYTGPIVDQQNRANTAISQALDEMWQEIAESS